MRSPDPNSTDFLDFVDPFDHPDWDIHQLLAEFDRIKESGSVAARSGASPKGGSDDTRQEGVRDLCNSGTAPVRTPLT